MWGVSVRYPFATQRKMTSLNLKSKLHRHAGARKHIAQGLLRSLFEHGKVETSEPRGKTLKRITDRLLTVAKQDTLAARKRVGSVFAEDKAMVKRVFETIPNLGDKNSGFTKLIRLGRRTGDGSERVRIELIAKLEKIKKEVEEAIKIDEAK